MPIDVIIDGKDNASAVLDAVTSKVAAMQGLTVNSEASVRDAYRATRSEVRLQAGSLGTLGMAYKANNLEVFAFTGALSRTGAVLGQVNRAYQQYTVMQIRGQQAAEAVTTAQNNYNDTVERYGSSSAQAIAAQKNLSDSQARATQVQQQNSAGIAGLIIQLGTQLPQAILASAQAWSTFSKIGGFSYVAGNISASLALIGGGSVAAGVATTGWGVALLGLTAILNKSIEPQMKQLQGIEFTTSETEKLTQAENRLYMSHDMLLANIKKGVLTQKDFNSSLGSTSGQYDELYQKVVNYGTMFQQMQGVYAGGKFIPTPPPVEPNYVYQKYLQEVDILYNPIVVEPTIPDPADKGYTITPDVIAPEIPEPHDQKYMVIPEVITPLIPQIPDQTYDIWGIDRGVRPVGVGGYAQGTSYVPKTGIALLHKGEAVLTAAQNRERLSSRNQSNTFFNYNQINNQGDARRTVDMMERRIVSDWWQRS